MSAPAFNHDQIGPCRQAPGYLFEHAGAHQAIHRSCVLGDGNRPEHIGGSIQFIPDIEPPVLVHFASSSFQLHAHKHGEKPWKNRTETWAETFGPKIAGKNRVQA